MVVSPAVGPVGPADVDPPVAAESELVASPITLIAFPPAVTGSAASIGA